MTRRKIKFKDISNELEMWALESSECPMKSALKTLGEKPQFCITGIITNCQGVVPLTHCKFCDGDKTFDETSMTIECTKEIK
jgi:hypothetical protein